MKVRERRALDQLDKQSVVLYLVISLQMCVGVCACNKEKGMHAYAYVAA